MPTFQTSKVLEAFHEYVSRVDSDNPDTSYDKYAAGPITAFTYVSKIGIQAISVNMVHTKLPKDKKWPICWRTSSFRSLWYLWSSCKIRTLTSATEEMNFFNPYGKRQIHATTTFKVDIDTLNAAHDAYSNGVASIRNSKAKDVFWTLILQPVLPEWICKGDANPLGLDKGTDKPLVIVNFTVSWLYSRDDEFIKATTQHAIKQIDVFATAKKTYHPWRYLNYCTDWQKPFDGYGEENKQFLQEMSRKYDPQGLFQRGCIGGFKLDMMNE